MTPVAPVRCAAKLAQLRPQQAAGGLTPEVPKSTGSTGLWHFDQTASVQALLQQGDVRPPCQEHLMFQLARWREKRAQLEAFLVN